MRNSAWIVQLHINIAERPIGGTHQILHGNRARSGIAEAHRRAESGIGRGRLVQERAGA